VIVLELNSDYQFKLCEYKIFPAGVVSIDYNEDEGLIFIGTDIVENRGNLFEYNAHTLE